MSSNSKRNGKKARRSTAGRPRKPRTRRVKPKIDIELEEKEPKTKVESNALPLELMSQEELDALNQTNSYLVNSQLMNNWFQRDIQFANRRAFDLEKLHNHLFDLETQANMDEKTLVALYNIGINDMNKRAQMMLKIAETSEKSRLIREINKRMADQAKKASIEGTEQSHTIKTLQLLLDESMRHTLEDECQKKYGSSNSYRPPEDESYEVLAIDINADE